MEISSHADQKEKLDGIRALDIPKWNLSITEPGRIKLGIFLTGLTRFTGFFLG